MRPDAGKFVRDRQRNPTLNVYAKSNAWVDVLDESATVKIDLSPHATSVRMSHTSVSVTVTWDGTGTFVANQPDIGDIIVVTDGGQKLAIMVIDEVNNYNEERGNRTLQITARSRDGVGPWRKRRYLSPRFQQGGTLAGAVREICVDQNLTESEYDLPLTGHTIPHTNVQFADTTPWNALQSIGLAIGRTPYCDALGRIKFYERAVDRVADIVLTNDDVIRVKGGKARPSISGYRLKWLDRNLTKVTQQNQLLGSITITAGFFKRTQRRDVYWSDDRRARSQNTTMRVIQSINSGIIPVGSESYAQQDQFHGEITVEVDAFVAGLATASLVALLALDYTPDGVLVAGIGASTGITVPQGRVIRGIAEASLLLIMMSIGVGSYEIWGEPIDWVHAVNKTEAFDENAPVWMDNVDEEQNDLIYDEAHAQNVAVRELLHRIASGNRWDTEILDDGRIEPGDILELPDTSRLYVTDYTRDLTRGAASVLSVSGFRC
jgi:hypothetical protein